MYNPVLAYLNQVYVKTFVQSFFASVSCMWRTHSSSCSCFSPQSALRLLLHLTESNFHLAFTGKSFWAFIQIWGLKGVSVKRVIDCVLAKDFDWSVVMSDDRLKPLSETSKLYIIILASTQLHLQFEALSTVWMWSPQLTSSFLRLAGTLLNFYLLQSQPDPKGKERTPAWTEIRDRWFHEVQCEQVWAAWHFCGLNCIPQKWATSVC